VAKRMTRRDIRQPDAFAQAVQNWFAKLSLYGKQILIGALGLLLVAGIAGVWQYQKSRENELLNIRVATLSQQYNETMRRQSTGAVTAPVNWGPLQTQAEALYEDAQGAEIFPIVLFYLFHIFVEQENYDAAVGVAQELRDVTQRGQEILQPPAVYAMAKAHELQGEYQTARVLLDQSLELTPNRLGRFLSEEVDRLQQSQIAPVDIEPFLASSETTETEGAEKRTMRVPVEKGSVPALPLKP